jgi:hypothetical protein
LFTDRSPIRDLHGIGEADLSFYGVTAAIDFGSRYDAKPHGSDEPPSILSFGTTLALSHAIGVGDIVRGDVDFSQGLSLLEVKERVLAHEFRLYVSSTLSQ